MKKIYLVLAHTGTVISRIIKIYTKDEFSHISISLDKELNEMYSFGRLNPYNPIIGGFVHEYIEKGTYKRFYKTKVKIYAIDVTDEQYKKIRKYIKRIEKNKEKYRFNILGLFAVGFNTKIRFKKTFYCAEFVKYILDKAGVDLDLPELVKPESFKDIEPKEEIYRGYLQNYNKPGVDSEQVPKKYYVNKNSV